MDNKKNAFTLIELLVVVAVIVIIATLAFIYLQSARANARDAKRISDIKQMQNALELYFNEHGKYPTESDWSAYGIIGTTSGAIFMHQIPQAPIVLDGDCDANSNSYKYISSLSNRNSSYSIEFCTGSSISSLPAGKLCASPGGITVSCPVYLQVGDVYQGGIIFYILQEGDYFYVDDGVQRGFIATTQDVGVSQGWSNIVNKEIGESAQIKDVGFGKSNSMAVINQNGHVNSAAKMCDDYIEGGYSDWFLPSKDELSYLYLNKDIIGGFTNNNYWSSSELNSLNAWKQDFSNGNRGHLNKINNYYVRCIRSF